MSNFRHRLEAGILHALGGMMRILPRNSALFAGGLLGELVFRLGIRVPVTTQNLTAAFPELSLPEIRRIARRCYRHFGVLMAEFSRIPLLQPALARELVEVEGYEVLDEALRLGKGAVVVTGHLGNWELMGASGAVLGYPVNYVVTGQENELVEQMMDDLRRNAGVGIIKRREALKEVIKTLRANELVAIVSDQDAHEAGAFVPFFGRLASTPRGAAIFCQRTGAALIFGESYRQGVGPLKVIYEFLDQTGLPTDRDEGVQEIVRRYTARLESAVRRHPEQWFWMHRRWKTLPPE
jgi:Kdo2-lipid IVA lauroyltransferase/acyltransferase